MAPVNTQKIAVILFNLGGPDQPEAVKPFLINLFSDPNIISAPTPIRWLLARLIAWRRTSVAQEIYAQIGGGSPIMAETHKQAKALELSLKNQKFDSIRCFSVMRYWHPRACDVLAEVKQFAPDHLVLLPLYPQFSTTTTRSSLQEWHRLTKSQGFAANNHEICCYPEQPDFITAHARLIKTQAPEYFGSDAKKKARLLFSAHGLPQKIVDKGDPYPQHIARTARAVAAKLDITPADFEVCYQSRVGPLKWLGPSTEERLRAAGAAKMPLVLVPIAFVSEHSETLVELDMEYKHLAQTAGVPDYIRIAALGVQPDFIHGLSQLVQNALSHTILCASETTKCPVNE